MNAEQQAGRLLVERLRDPEKYVDACDEAADWIEHQLDEQMKQAADKEDHEAA